MVQLGLKFRARATEQEFIRLRKPLFQHFLFFVIFLLCFVITTVVTGFQTYIYPLLTILVCVGLIIAVACIIPFKNFRFVELFVMLACLIVYLLFLDFGQRQFISFEDLAIGHFIGFFERVIVERLPMLRHKASYGIFVGICRIVLIRYYNVTNCLFSGCLTCFGLLLDYSKEKKEREIFELFHDSRETLVKFQELFKSYLSESILILKSNLAEPLFTNDSFQKNFRTITKESVKEFLEEFELEREEASIAVSSLRDIKLEGEEDDPRSGRVSLYNFLDALQAIRGSFDNICFDHIFSYPSLDSQGNVKKLKVKAFHFVWDSQSALVLVITDITEHYSLMNLRLADENKDKLVATVSHELRTPLNGILGVMQILDKEITQPHLTKYLNTCKNSARLLLSLVNSILDSAQIKNNKLRLHPENHKIKDIVEDILSLFEFQCNQKKIYLKTEQDSTLPEEIFTDKNRLSQILINLIGNALKFTFTGGITLVIASDNLYLDSIKFSVVDTGVGIQEKDRQNLFRMYGKLEGTANLNPQGVGLGLHISSILARLLNENEDSSGIKVESEMQKGSTFSFLIKKRLPEAAAQTPVRMRGKSEEKNNFSVKRYRINYQKAEPGIPEEDDIEKIFDLDEINSKDDGVKETKVSKGTIALEVSEKLNRYFSNTRASKNLGSRTSVKIPRSSYRDDSSSMSFNLDQSMVMTPKLNLLTVGSPTIFQRGISSSRRSSRFNVLIVDDNPFNLLVARELVEMQGYNADTALNGQAAIEMVKRRNHINDPFKLILMDCEMPVLGGLETTKILVEKMKAGEIGEIPIVALTANSVEQVQENCLEAGMLECLSKPLMEADVRNILVKYI